MFLGALVMTASALIPVFAGIGTTTGLIVAGIALVVGGFTLLMNHVQGFKEMVMALWDGFVSSISNSASQFGAYLQPIQDSFSRLWQGLLPFLNMIGVVVTSLIAVILPLVTGLFRALGPLVALIVNVISLAINTLSMLLAFLVGDWQAGLQFSNNASQEFANIFLNVWNVLAEFVMGIVNTVVSMLSAMGVSVNVVLSSMASFFVIVFQSISQTAVTWASIFVSVISSGINSARNFFSSGLSSMRTIASNMLNGIRSVV
jgi:phage-related protein